jgi:hypothetical protein
VTIYDNKSEKRHFHPNHHRSRLATPVPLLSVNKSILSIVSIANYTCLTESISQVGTFAKLVAMKLNCRAIVFGSPFPYNECKAKVAPSIKVLVNPFGRVL